MKIELTKIKVADLFDGYVNNEEEGVKGYHGLLNIRPAYQREFVYKDKQRDAVIETINKGFPLNTMYWVRNEDGTFELLDGQQRTISICSYLCGIRKGFYVAGVNEGRLFDFERDKDTEFGQRILNYELMVYICDEGTKDERLGWFRTINIAGEKLTEQELLNAQYTGAWLYDAKKWFSKTNCPAYIIANDKGKQYVKGSPIRQELLETALSWISDGDVQGYMETHWRDASAIKLWNYFSSVVDWVKTMFPVYRKEMASVDWGTLYRKYGELDLNPATMESRISELMANEEVTVKKGVYEYLLSGEDEDFARKLSKRAFSDRDKRTVYEQQKHICPICGMPYEYSDMEGDHIKPWWLGGTTTLDNLQMVCKRCNGKKSGKTLKTE